MEASPEGTLCRDLKNAAQGMLDIEPRLAVNVDLMHVT